MASEALQTLEKKGGIKKGRMLISVSVPADQWEAIESAIDLTGGKVSTFFFEAALARTRQVLAQLRPQK
jgi:uncharacterized protein (DUF1778 family)